MNGFRPVDSTMNSLPFSNKNTTEEDTIKLPDIDFKKDLIKPINNSSELSKYKKDDLIKIHEFRRENIREPYKELENRDFFTFTNEDDPKYKFVNAQYMLRSKLLIKSIIWSFGIGCAFFMHRYIRKQQFRNALRWGVSSWTFSMFFIWGSSELQPHVVAIFHSQFLRDLSNRDQIKYKQIGNLEQDKMYVQQYYQDYGVSIKCDELNIESEVAKISFDYDNVTLANFNYKTNSIEKMIRERGNQESNAFDENSSENEIIQGLANRPDIEYDFSFHNKLIFGDHCVISTKQFLKFEKELAKDKFILLKNDVLSKENIVNVKNLMKAELAFAEKYLNGLYNDFNEDPDYKKY